MSLLNLGLKLLGHNYDRKVDKRNYNLAKYQFDAQMDQTIQRRVADAEKAGIHPLFAMGASAGASPTSSVTNSGAGGKAAAALSEELTRAQIRKTNAEADTEVAEARVLSSAAQADQALASTGRDLPAQAKAGLVAGEPDAGNPKVEILPRAVTATKERGVAAGRAPLFEEFVDDKGNVIRTYSTDSQMDELRQIDVAQQQLRNWLSQELMPVYAPKVKGAGRTIKGTANKIYLRDQNNKFGRRLKYIQAKNRLKKLSDWQLTKKVFSGNWAEKKAALAIQHERSIKK